MAEIDSYIQKSFRESTCIRYYYSGLYCDSQRDNVMIQLPQGSGISLGVVDAMKAIGLSVSNLNQIYLKTKVIKGRRFKVSARIWKNLGSFDPENLLIWRELARVTGKTIEIRHDYNDGTILEYEHIATIYPPSGQ